MVNNKKPSTGMARVSAVIVTLNKNLNNWMMMVLMAILTISTFTGCASGQSGYCGPRYDPFYPGQRYHGQPLLAQVFNKVASKIRCHLNQQGYCSVHRSGCQTGHSHCLQGERMLQVEMRREQIGIDHHTVEERWNDSVYIGCVGKTNDDCNEMAKAAMQATYGQPGREAKVRAFILNEWPNAKIEFKHQIVGKQESVQRELWPNARGNGNGDSELVFRKGGADGFAELVPANGSCRTGGNGVNGIVVESRSGNTAILMNDADYINRASQQWGGMYIQDPSIVRPGLANSRRRGF